MDIPVVLSHRTAWLFYHAPLRDEVLASNTDFGISELGIPAREVARRIQRFLTACGVPKQELDTLDAIMSMSFMRTDAGIFTPHSFGNILSESDVHELVPGLCIAREELCFLQAAAWMTPLEHVEFGYELCGRYETSLGSAPYREREPLTTRSATLSYIESHAGMHGTKDARRALVRIRDGSRSPMETATALMVALPRKVGGLGYRGIELNSRLEAPRPVQTLTRSAELEVDIYAQKRKVGIEYDGEDHAEASQRARDAERLAALAAMGIRVHVITKGQFAEQLSLHRALNAVARDLGIRLEATTDFQRTQNNLRLELIRSWNRS